MTRPTASVLIVGDDELVCGSIRASLDPVCWCATAATAEQAEKLLESDSFDVVLSDITMRGASALEFCRHVQKTCPRTVVIVISAMTDIQCAIEAMRQGAFDYITKPFDLTRVTMAVERALRYRRALEDRHLYEQALEERVRIRTAELRSANDDLNFMLDALYRNYRATLQGLARTLEARDIETRGHSDRVVAYSMRLGKQMGLSSIDLLALEQGALLHDIGKIGVPDAILLKPGSLNTEEWVKMRDHVAHGLRIIENVEFLSGASSVIGQHHEKYDGSGYPNKLRGDGIHIHARIFAVADAFDAIRSDRPYRGAQSYERACDELIAYAGSHFDPKVINAFMSISKDEWEMLHRRPPKEDSGEYTVDKSAISSFIFSLGAPAQVTSKLRALVA